MISSSSVIVDSETLPRLRTLANPSNKQHVILEDMLESSSMLI
jgi:hypothetical protein